MDIPSIVRGDRAPDMLITISDERDDADFSTLTAADCTIVGEMDDVILFERQAADLEVAPDSKSAVVRASWLPDDVDTAGRLWVQVRVNWSGSLPQTFPRGSALPVDIRRAAGDD